jgi:hypothetical protein
MMFMRAASGTRAHLWFAAFLAGTSPGALPSEASLARLPVQDRIGCHLVFPLDRLPHALSVFLPLYRAVTHPRWTFVLLLTSSLF